MKYITMALGSLVALAGTSVSAAPVAQLAQAEPIQRQTISLTLANQLVTGTLEACSAIGQTPVVAVVDAGGNLVALQRSDDVGPHNTIAAQRKAFTALSTKTKTSVMAQRAATDPSSANLVSIPELLLLGGGVPVLVDGKVIGAVGVAAAGGSANDEMCAVKAIEAALPAS